MPHAVQVQCRISQASLRVFRQGTGQMHGHPFHPLQRVRQGLRELGLVCDSDIRSDGRHQGLERGAVAHQNFASQKIHALDPMGSLMNMVQSVVPIIALDRIVAGIAGATQHLDRVLVRLKTEFRRPGFCDGRQDLKQESCGVVSFPLPINQRCAIDRQRQRGFNGRFLRH